MNPYIIIGIIGAILLSGLGGGFVGWHERAVRVPAELTAQSQTDAQECEKAQQLTKGANDALQKNRDTIAAQLKSYKLQHPPTCLRVTGTANASSGGPQHAAGDGSGTGLSSDWLRDYAAQAEQYRGEVSVCSTFLQQERQLTAPGK